jgi:hypothetical protein
MRFVVRIIAMTRRPAKQKTTGPKLGGAGSANAAVTFIANPLWRRKHVIAPQENASQDVAKIAFAKQDVLPSSRA